METETDKASILTSTSGNAKIGQSKPADLVSEGAVVKDFKMKVDKSSLGENQIGSLLFEC